MPIFDNLRVIFIHIPKNAGTSITQWLEEQNGQPPLQEGHYPWLHYALRYPDRWKAYTKVAVVRHPIDRALSCYNYARMEKSYWHSPDGSTAWPVHQDYNTLKDKTFEQCLQLLKAKRLHHPTWAAQYHYLFDDQGRLQVDYLLRFEHLQQDFATFARVMRWPEKDLPVINVSKKDGNTEISPVATAGVEELYRLDFLLLNYPLPQ